MKTRSDYVNGNCTHREYYSQFVNGATRRAVGWILGVEAIGSSMDRSFNDIPLPRWDSFAGWLPMAIGFREVGDYPTLAGYVCVAKEAARQVKEEGQ